MSNLFQKLRRCRHSWPERPRSIKFDDAGFSITEEGCPDVRGNWASIHEIFAFKLDLFAYDEICIGLRFDSAGTHRWVGESYVGYREFLDELSRRFSGMRTDWFAGVAHPAFKENRTSLWGEEWSPKMK